MIQTKPALLIIDMQKGSFTEETPRFDTHGVVTRINQLSKHFRSLGLPVIFIQHDGTGSGSFEKNTLEWQNLNELVIEAEDLLIDKTANDSFYKSKLQHKLVTLGVNQLLITGCATDFCVESTLQSALAKDYDVTIVSDAHTTGNRPHLSSKQVIEHYNWVWENMLPTKGKIVLQKTEKLLTKSYSKL